MFRKSHFQIKEGIPLENSNFDLKGFQECIDNGGLRQEEIFKMIRHQNDILINPLNQGNIENFNNRVNVYQSNSQGTQGLNTEIEREKREQLKKLMKQTQQNLINQHMFYGQLNVPQRRSSNNNNNQTQNQSQNQNSQRNTSQNNEPKTTKKK